MNGQLFDIMLLSKKGYNCSQIMAILLLKSLGINDPDLVRALGGLCYCLEYSGQDCGVLPGGACLISLCAGKGSDAESQRNSMLPMILELVEWFRKKTDSFYTCSGCDGVILPSPNRSFCTTLVSETYEKVLSILASHGFYILGVDHGISIMPSDK
jgi:hypothetical protein